jgi:hypothetical protein
MKSTEPRMRIRWHRWLVHVAVGLPAATVFAASASDAEALNLRDRHAIRRTAVVPSCWASAADLKGWLFTKPAIPAPAPGEPGSSAARWSPIGASGEPLAEAAGSLDRMPCLLDRDSRRLWAVGIEGGTPAARHLGAPAFGAESWMQSQNVGDLVQHARAVRWCGRDDWRLPTRAEAVALANYEREFPKHRPDDIRTRGLANHGIHIWTSSLVAGGPSTAHFVGTGPTTGVPAPAAALSDDDQWVFGAHDGSTGRSMAQYQRERGVFTRVLLVVPASCRAFGKEHWR